MEETIKVKHGFWDLVHHYQNKADGICSICRKHGRLRVSRDEWGVWYIDSPYCPACGSIMDGKINYARKVNFMEVLDMRHWSNWIPIICMGIGAMLIFLCFTNPMQW